MLTTRIALPRCGHAPQDAKQLRRWSVRVSGRIWVCARAYPELFGPPALKNKSNPAEKRINLERFLHALGPLEWHNAVIHVSP
jgi:hypothetical protein